MTQIGSLGIASRRRQRGATFLGMLIIVSILGCALYAGIRLVPLYKEFMDVTKAMTQTATSLGEGATAADIRKSLDRRWEVDDIKSIQPKDIAVTRIGETTILRAKYRAEAPFVANVSLVVDFEKAVKMGGGAVP